MGTVSVRSAADGATVDQIFKTLEDAFQQMAQALAGIRGSTHQRETTIQEALRREMQDALLRQELKMNEALRRQDEVEKQRVREALRLQEQMAEWKLQDGLRETVEKMQENDEEIQALEQRLEENTGRMEERVTAVETRLSSVVSETNTDTRGQGDVHHLEDRMRNLEASVQRALETVFPRVLVSHLESPSSPAPTSSTSTTSSSSSASCSSSASPRPSPHDSHLKSSIVSGTTSPCTTPESRASVGRELLEAATSGRLDDVRRLLDAGADINFGYVHGKTLLMQAAFSTYEDVVRLLLERGANVHARDVTGWTALHYAACNDLSGRRATPLIAAGARVDGRNDNGWTPLHFAARCNRETAVRALLAAGANKTLGNIQGQTPFDLTSRHEIRRHLRP